MISHKLEDDGNVTIRSGVKVVSAPMSEVVALAYRIIEDLDPNEAVAPLSFFIEAEAKDRVKYGMQMISILTIMKAGDWTAGEIGRRISRSSNHVHQQLLRYEKGGLVESYLSPKPVRHRYWRITREGHRRILANRG